MKKINSLTKIILITIIVSIILAGLNIAPKTCAQTEPTVTVIGADGTQLVFTLTQLQNMPSTSGNGGFYQTNQQIGNRGIWTGVSVLYLCNQVGGISANSNITVTGQGNNSFTYDMVASGMRINDGYKTYNDTTGIETNQTQPIVLILAYQVNGTNLPSSSQPAPRLVIVGPEGLLIDGSGGRSITKVTIENIAPEPTPTPTPVPTLSPTHSPTPSPAPTATPSPTASPTPTPSPTPTTTPTATPESTGSNGWPITYTAAIIAVVILIIIGLAVVILRRK